MPYSAYTRVERCRPCRFGETGRVPHNLHWRSHGEQSRNAEPTAIVHDSSTSSAGTAPASRASTTARAPRCSWLSRSPGPPADGADNTSQSIAQGTGHRPMPGGAGSDGCQRRVRFRCPGRDRGAHGTGRDGNSRQTECGQPAGGEQGHRRGSGPLGRHAIIRVGIQVLSSRAQSETPAISR